MFLTVAREGPPFAEMFANQGLLRRAITALCSLCLDFNLAQLCLILTGCTRQELA
ncbi:hypothetical protein [Phaeobacter inhibens]|uniref:hypothetical protein n=1 Tax=Phaeobacter inhibens TaxID=221822 RepID=UPI0018D27001|nr:hypothetical protein [Phaeobacter inhibens]WHP68767.1 hypothetical protein QMZ01_00835 [Phaeobacter inhibens]